MFFTSREGLVLSDTNEKLDAYQWNGGLEVGKISTGRSSFDSKLLSVSADGTDAFFFTRDVLVPTDENGGAVKIYDARADGGYLQSSRRLPCAASDECHGPGTPQPPPAQHQLDHRCRARRRRPRAEAKPKPKKCKKGFVKKHGKCVKKHAQARTTQPPDGDAMAEPTTSKERTKMSTQPQAARSSRPRRPLQAALAFAASLAAIAIFALPGQAKPEISFFEVKSSNTEAGAHPDITTIFKLARPGRTGSRENDRSRNGRRASSATPKPSRAAAASTSP